MAVRRRVNQRYTVTVNGLFGGCAAWLHVIKGKLRAMKNTHTCPKCNSREIMRIEGRSGGYGGGNDIPAGSYSFRTVKVTRYLCGSCGFSEEWIDAPEDLHKLKEKYGSS